MSVTSLSQAKTPPTRITLILLTAVAVLTLNLFLPSLPSMAADFNVSYGAISFTIAGYLFLSAALSLVLGPLADKYGRRPVLLTTFSIFALASVGAAVTENFALFLMFRMLQAVCAAGSSLSRAIVRDIHPPGRGTSVLAYISMAMAIAPMLGPMVGGLMEETLGWRSVFWLFAAMGFFCVALMWVDLGETAPGKGNSFKQQVVGYKTILQSKMFWSHTMVIGFSITAFFIFLSGAPLVASSHFNLAPSRVGLALGSIAVGFFIGSFIAARVSERVSRGKMLIWGRRIAVVGPLCAFALVMFDLTTPIVFFGLLTTMGLGNGISIPSANTGAMSVRADLAGSASGLSAAMATTMGAISSALTGAILTPENAMWLFVALLILACFASLIFAHLAAKELEKV